MKWKAPISAKQKPIIPKKKPTFVAKKKAEIKPKVNKRPKI